MSIPTFSGTQLFSKAARDLPGSPAPRARVETMPGADGEYVQPLGVGGRDIVARGLLEGAAQSTAALAHQSLKAALRSRQALADGATVAAYLGTDAHSYDNCMLVSFAASGEVQVYRDGANYRAAAPVEAKVHQLTP